MTRQNRFRIVAILMVLINASLSAAALTSNAVIKDESRRQVLSLNANWSYLEDDCAQLSGLAASKAAWQKIDLPHTWNTWDAVDPIPGYGDHVK